MALDKAKLLAALRSVAPAIIDTPFASMLACGDKIDASHYTLPSSLFVQGLGELPLPLSSSDTSRLIGLSEQAPYGKGSAAVVDSLVCEARQVDASLLANDPHNSTFFLNTIQEIAKNAIAKLGMDVHAIHLDAKLYKLLLYEAGGHFEYHRDTERECGMFGTLIIQLPTESPHQGGQLLVHHAKSSITFDFSGSKDSHKFYYTAFFADCKHKLNMIAMGSRVCLVFNLVWRSMHATLSRNIPEACLAGTTAALKPWLEGWNGEEAPKKLFIPLEHEYTKDNLCFAGLKGRDSLVSAVLQAYNRNASEADSLEVHLCILTKHRLFDGHEVETGFETENWVGIDDKDVNLSRIDVDVSSELLVEEEDLFEDTDEEGHEDYTGDEYRYEMAMLVIWPKRKTTLIACNGKFTRALDVLQANLSLGVNIEAQTLFKDLLDFLHANPRRKVLGPEDRGREAQCKVICRLLQICSQIGSIEDMLKVIDILANSKEKTDLQHPCFQQINMYAHEEHGIASDEVAKMLALAVKTHGWDACGRHVEDKLLLGSRIKSECEYYAKLALEFDALDMHDAAVCIAAKVHALVCNSNSQIRELPAPGVGGLMVMLFALQECHDILAPVSVDCIIRDAPLVTLCETIVKLIDTGSNNLCDAPTKMLFCLKGDPHLLGLFTKLCNALTSGKLKLPAKRKNVMETTKGHILRVIEAYLRLDNSTLLEGIVKSIVLNAQTCKDQVLLREVINSSSFWQKASATEMGSNAFKALVGERIRKLSSKSKPVFSWCQPLAVLPRYATVQAFLRGPLEKFTYGPFTGLPQAQNFARKYFGWYGSQQSGYSATATEGRRGQGAYCTIVKTRRVFEDMEKQWQAWQGELARLKKSIHGISEECFEENAKGEQNAATSAVVEERHLFEVKRLKTIPAGIEVIDLT